MPNDINNYKYQSNSTMSAQMEFFADKRFGTKDQVVGLVGMDSMAFDNVGCRSNGIRPWEKARFEANMQRQKQTDYFDNQRLVNRMKNTNDGPSKKEIQDAADKRREDERIAAEKLRYERENVKMGGYVGSGNDAWD
jgi:hypothetical protein